MLSWIGIFVTIPLWYQKFFDKNYLEVGNKLNITVFLKELNVPEASYIFSGIRFW